MCPQAVGMASDVYTLHCRLYERLGEDECAAGAYAEYIMEAECNGVGTE